MDNVKLIQKWGHERDIIVYAVSMREVLIEQRKWKVGIRGESQWLVRKNAMNGEQTHGACGTFLVFLLKKNPFISVNNLQSSDSYMISGGNCHFGESKRSVILRGHKWSSF